jgi:molybdenum cofactor cytidylyltransferase
MSCAEVGCVLLAAGTSSRMGKNKLFLEIDGETVLRRAVRTAVAARLDPVLVTLGHESDRARAELDGLPCLTVINPRCTEGMSTSLSAGISALPEGPAAAVVMLADMPFVTAAMLRQLVSRWRGEPLVVSLFGDVVAPPILYARPLFAELSALDGESCGKRVIKQHRAQAAEVRWPAFALLDLDVPGDLERVLHTRPVAVAPGSEPVRNYLRRNIGDYGGQWFGDTSEGAQDKP